MAEDKSSFILYADYLAIFEDLEDVEAGKLIKHILRYVNDQNPETEDKIVRVAFIPIKQQLKRDLRKWEGERDGRSAAGRLGGIKSAEARRSKTKQNEANPSSASNPEAKASTASKKEANQAVNVTVTVTDTVNDISLKEIFFNDLPNSRVFEDISRELFVPIDKLLEYIPDFRKTCSVSYKDFKEFGDHFKRTVGKRLREDKPGKKIAIQPNIENNSW